MTYYQKYLKDKVGCFSPPVMIATFIIEIFLAVYVFARYKQSLQTRLAILLLVFLAIFQLAEYFVCGGVGLSAEVWSRIGYASITMLPPLGIHLCYALAGKRLGKARSVYSLAVVFICYFLFVGNAFTGNYCAGNYVIFQMQSWAVTAFTAYYYGLLLWAVIGGLIFGYSRPKQRKALLWFVGGYVFFLLPTITVTVVRPELVAGIPSIMCGFAVILALVLTFKVLPAAAKLRKK